MPEAGPLLQIEHLTKVFRRGWLRGPKDLCAVDNLSLTVPKGAVYGFLGPNGAGKSTTLRMALGLIHPTQGRVSIGGHDVAHACLQALRRVGAFVESPSFYNYLPGRRNLELLSGLSGGASSEEIDGILERVGLQGRADDRVKVYSHGMRARLGLAACLLPCPELLILDEPTDGLDPHGIHEVRNLIRSLAADDGLTVFLSSHMLGEVENLCTHIAIIDHGRLIVEGELEALERQHRRWCLETTRTTEAMGVLAERLGLDAASAPKHPNVLQLSLDGKPPEEIVAALSEGGVPIRSFSPEANWLDRLFLELTSTHEADHAQPKEVA